VDNGIGERNDYIEAINNYPYKWDFVQLQINYYDWEAQNAKAYYEALEERNIPCIVMEPVRGGSLHTLNDEARAVFDELGNESYASYALRYVAQLPNVLTVLSGMSTFEQVEDNLRTFEECKPLSENEAEAVSKANILFRKNFAIPCTDCRYCTEKCPAGIDIPACFKAYNEYNKTRDDADFKEKYLLIPGEKQAHNCINCKLCEKTCPQQIKISDKLRKIAEMNK
jgi:predicted aldo/keto reductase-like oxidoreductase